MKKNILSFLISIFPTLWKYIKKMPSSIKWLKLLITIKLKGDKMTFDDFLPFIENVLDMIKDKANDALKDFNPEQIKRVQIAYCAGRIYLVDIVEDTKTEIDDKVLANLFEFCETEAEDQGFPLPVF